MDLIARLLIFIMQNNMITQRDIAQSMAISLGSANKLISIASEQNLIAKEGSGLHITGVGEHYLDNFKMDGAVILAAGFGSRFVPLTWDTPKGLLPVFGERMIERQISQLHEVGIYDITIIVGYMKEKFDYLIDKYGVKLLYNPEYDTKNTIASLYIARHLFYDKHMYLLSSDNWLKDNIYHTYEAGSWYAASYMAGDTKEWCLTFNKKGFITHVDIGGHDSYAMYGPVCFFPSFSKDFFPILEEYYKRDNSSDLYWENVYNDIINGDYKGTLQSDGVHTMCINKCPSDTIYEFENLEELRAFDPHYMKSSDNKAMALLSEVFDVPESDITEIRRLKAGMTNNSFLFRVRDNDYICRIPGAGTDKLIDRKAEYNSYIAVKSLDITDDIIYLNPDNGYKISTYYKGCRNANPLSDDDMDKCMSLVHRLHTSGISVEHDFDIAKKISFYENLCLEYGSIPFEDYQKVRSMIDEIVKYLDSLSRPKCLCHIDSVADNFLFIPDDKDGQKLRLIDWEYAGMADPFIDIAMCSIYSYYDDDRAVHLLSLYLGHRPDNKELDVFRSYMALGGFLWMLWAVYKENLGIRFGEYTLKMYRYAKDCYAKLTFS